MSDVHANAPTRIAVVDDDISVRELVSNHINNLENCKVMLQAGDGQELLDKIGTKPVIDLVILDIMMDGLNGYDTARIISKEYPALRILFYTICKNDLAINQMAACGGHGLIQKGKSAGQIAMAIKTVMSGYYFFPDMVENRAISDNNCPAHKSNLVNDLSAEQTQFLQLVGSNQTYKEIADKLKISIRQVDYIREGLFRQLNVQSRVELAIIALESGFVPIHTSLLDV